MFVEPPSRFINRVDHHRANAHDVRGLFDPRQGVEQKRLAEPFALLRSVHGQSCQQDDPDWMPGQPFVNPLRTLVLVNGTGRQRIVARYAIPGQCYVGFGRIRLLVCPGIFFVPGVEGRIAAVELGEVVLTPELLDREFGIDCPAQ